MGISYDDIKGAFLSKVHSYDLYELAKQNLLADDVVSGYLRFACSQFNKICKYDLLTSNAEGDGLAEDVAPGDVDEIVDIISDGMIVQWMKPYVNRQELLVNLINTRDFTTYSPGELLLRVGNAYKDVQATFTRRMREYSYDHGDLTVLHL